MSANPFFEVKDTQILTDPNIIHIAIPNPKLAPYGRASEEFLTSQNLLQALSPKFAFGDSIGQATNLVLQGGSEIGFSALSMVIQNKAENLTYTIIDQALYQPIKQALIIPNHGTNSDLAKKFAEFILHSKQAKALLKSYGYDVDSQ